MRSILTTPAIALIILGGCGEPAPQANEPAKASPLSGGDTTIFDRTSSAFTFPAPNLSTAEAEAHLRGDVHFEATFVSPPAEINPGLGPQFNSSACAACHVKNGRGLPEAGQGPVRSPLLVRVSLASGKPDVPGGPVPVPGLGTQIQDHAILGYAPDATVGVEWTYVAGAYADGAAYELRKPAISIVLHDGSPLPADVLTSPRIPQPVFGLGLLEAVGEDALLAMADPDDADGDGVSGRPNYVWSKAAKAVQLGRFGWKANEPDLAQQSADAFAGDMGIASPLNPNHDGSTDITADVAESAAFYTRTLAVPARVFTDDAVALRGERLFRQAGCSACHVETLTTGASPIAGMANQVIHPYTDLLLHDMGAELADNRPDFEASGREWRTAPLWGIGLTHTVLPEAGFLHDGRARTLEEAILWHGGEAEQSREAFRHFAPADREALVRFLLSL